MRFIELRASHDPSKLDELAAFRLLSFMCFPKDVVGRERFLGTIQLQTGAGRPRRSPLDFEQFGDCWALHRTRGCQVGELLLTFLQV
jgi:hypothetical protein